MATESHSHSHPHTHEHWDQAGQFQDREVSLSQRDFATRAFTVGIGGPVGSGKTALLRALCERLRDRYQVAVVTNDIFTEEDAQFLTRHQVLAADRITAVVTGGCPHAAIREDISLNLNALESLMTRFENRLDLLFVESGGDNLAATFSRELADYILYVIDVSGGDKIPRKGGPGITQSDLLIINKTDIAEQVGADLDVMARDAETMRDGGPFLFTQARHNLGIDEVIKHIEAAFKARQGIDAPTTSQG